VRGGSTNEAAVPVACSTGGGIVGLIIFFRAQTWVKIQQRTFTRWCNTFLVERMMKIEDFLGDFTDGVQFCNLLEVISGKKLPKWNVKPRIKQACLCAC
jgi:hypothetical protein